MKKKPKYYENYPFDIVFTTFLFNLSIWLIGLYLTYLITPILSFLFLLYMIFIELSVYVEGCKYCCYYGKWCAFGRGKLAKLFIKKGNPKKFCSREIGWKDFVPQIFGMIVPIVSGIYVLMNSFSWNILALTLWPIFVWFIGNPILYGNLVCAHCKQGKKCCPALKFFSKK